jgi:3-isopropylmalate/(R)-2-methylmalate dehydratase small subunit
LLDYGFRCLIAPSYADIFFNNCFANGILPVVLPEETVDALFTEVEATPGYTLHVSLPEQVVVTSSGVRHHFQVDAFQKDCLLRGLDAIGWTLQFDDDIAAYEAKRGIGQPVAAG